MRKLLVLLLLLTVFLEGSTCVPTTPAFTCAGTPVDGVTTSTLSCVQTGDFLIAASCGNVGSSGTQTISCPTGWTAAGGLAGNADGNHIGQQVCYKVATGSDTSSSTYTFTYNGTGTGFQSSAIMDFRGGSTTLDQTATHNISRQYFYALPVTTTIRSDMVVYLYCYGATGNARSYTDVPPGATLTAYQGASTLQNALYASYVAQPLPGTTAAEFVTGTCGCSNGQNTVAFGGAP